MSEYEYTYIVDLDEYIMPRYKCLSNIKELSNFTKTSIFKSYFGVLSTSELSI